MSNSTSTTSNTSELTQLVLEHITHRLTHMKVGDLTETKFLFAPEYWKSTSGVDHRFLGTVISILVAQKKLPLESAGFTSSRHNLYRKI